MCVFSGQSVLLFLTLLFIQPFPEGFIQKSGKHLSYVNDGSSLILTFRRSFEGKCVLLSPPRFERPLF